MGGGKAWGIRLHVSGRDPGALFSVQRRTLPRARNPVGPLRPILQPEPPRLPKVTQAPVVTRTPGWNNTEMPKPAPGRTEAPGELRLLLETSHQGLLGTREAMFRFLSKTSPNITKGCWLCLNPEPPYYVGIGTNISFGQNASEIRNYSVQRLPEGLCVWGHQSRLTLEDLQGAGTCIAPVNYLLGSSPYLSSCTQVTELPQEYDESLKRYFVAPEGIRWACSNGIVPCAFSPSLLSPTDPGICILTHILPQAYYYSGEGGREHLRLEPRRYKWAPVLVPLLVGLGLAGSAAPITGHQNYREQGQQVDQDLSTLEKSVGQLEDSLSSLAERGSPAEPEGIRFIVPKTRRLVLGTRRGLLFLHKPLRRHQGESKSA